MLFSRLDFNADNLILFDFDVGRLMSSRNKIGPDLTLVVIFSQLVIV